MKRTKALLAIFASLTLGMMVSTFLPGCQPPAGPTRGTTPSLTTNDEGSGKPAEEKPAEKPAEAAPAEEKPTEEKPAETKPAEETPAETKPAEEVPAETKPAEEKPAEEKPAEAAKEPAGEQVAAVAAPEAAKPLPAATVDEHNQWGRGPTRNNVVEMEGILTDFAPGKFERKTGKWKPETAKNIKWVVSLGSESYGNPVVASGKLFVGTNNGFGYLKRYPGDYDLGCLLAFSEADGKFLWQHSSEKLHTGRVHDWPKMGICCSPLVEGERLWFVTSRGEVRCLDTEGYYDGEDDGPVKNEPARLFEMVKADDPAMDKVQPILDDLEAGKISAGVRTLFTKAGVELPAEVSVAKDPSAKAPAQKWKFQAEVDGKPRDFYFTLTGPRLTAFRITTPDDKNEADVIWVFDMMKELGISQHNMCSCSVTAVGDLLFVNTSNGVDDAHIAPPSPDAPSFIVMDKNTGKVHWTDNTPGGNILHGQWSSPAVGVIGGVPQVIFGGGDGWMYSFKADEGKDGKPELLWKFDANPKNTILELGGRGTRNDIISTPVIYNDLVYFATGQDPEHGEGVGILWCIDPTKRGDISAELAVNRADPEKPIPVKRVQAVEEEKGDMAIPNPNHGVVWKYTEQDNDGDGKIDPFLEKFHRSIGTVVIKNDLLFLADFSGLVHCVDAKTGKVHWTQDMLAASWGSPLIVGDKVYVGDEDGDIAIYALSGDRNVALKKKGDNWIPGIAKINMGSSVYSTPIVAGGTLYIANKDHVFAIAPSQPVEAAGGGK